MNELKSLRNEIDKVDRELAALFLRRMELVEKISLYKKEQVLPVFDQKREEEMQASLEASFARADLLPYYRRFVGMLLTLSKEYQRNGGGI